MEASPSPVYGARLLSGFGLIPIASSNLAASANVKPRNPWSAGLHVTLLRGRPGLAGLNAGSSSPGQWLARQAWTRTIPGPTLREAPRSEATNPCGLGKHRAETASAGMTENLSAGPGRPSAESFAYFRPRRALSPSSSVSRVAGRVSPNVSNHSWIWGSSAAHSSVET